MILNNVKTQFIGKNIQCFETISSTQEYVKELDKQGKAVEGEIIFAERQTNGIGTHERKWFTGKNDNLAFSFVLFPNCDIQKLDTLTRVIAESFVQAIKELYLISLQIKKPNDIIFQNKKIGGILTESVTKGRLTKKVFIGVGFNVNQESFPRKLRRYCNFIKERI